MSDLLRIGWTWLVVGALALGFYAVSECAPKPAHAEMYLTAMGGWNMPGDFSGFHAEYAWQGRQFEDGLKLQNGVAYGGKLGWSPASAPWLAVELQAIKSWPNQKEQAFVQFARPPGGNGGWQVNSGTLAGTQWKMIQVGANVLLRHHLDNGLMLYSGLGAAFFPGSSYGGAIYRDGLGVDFIAGVKGNVTDDGKYRWMIEAHKLYSKQTYRQIEVDGMHNGFTGHYETTMIFFGLERTFWLN